MMHPWYQYAALVIPIGLGAVIAFFIGWIILALSHEFYVSTREQITSWRWPRNYWQQLVEDNEKPNLAFRADNQHAAFLAGDPYGLYGHYPPADLTWGRSTG